MPRAKLAISDPDTIRTRLLHLVEADGRSHRSIAHDAGLHQPTLSRVLSGGRTDPSVSTVGALLRALGRSWADLD
jgi:DNA-binding phage protein